MTDFNLSHGFLKRITFAINRKLQIFSIPVENRTVRNPVFNRLPYKMKQGETAKYYDGSTIQKIDPRTQFSLHFRQFRRRNDKLSWLNKVTNFFSYNTASRDFPKAVLQVILRYFINFFQFFVLTNTLVTGNANMTSHIA